MRPDLVQVLGVLCIGISTLLHPAVAAGQVRLWAIDDMVRINPETSKAFEENPKQLPGCISGDYRSENWIWSAKDQTVQLWAGRNEVVAFQLVIEGKADRVTVEASDLAGAGGAVIGRKQIQLFREWYIWVDSERASKACMAPLGKGWYPDVAIPLSEPKYGNGFSIPSKDFHDPAGRRFPKQKNQAVWVDLHVPKDAKPGQYTGRITVTADGRPQAIKVKLHVWDFTIPSEMHMHAELMNYGQTIREPDRQMMYNYFRLAQEHRTFISDNKVKPAYNGTDYDWKEFDEKFGPLFDGSLFVDGPTAGVPIPCWTVPIEYGILRPDKRAKPPKRDWPIPAPKTPTGFGVQFTEQFKKDLARAIKAFDAHFLARGWTKTRLAIFQDCLDEPGFHKSGKGLEAGKEQAVTIYETAKIVKEANPKLAFYKLDIGGGNNRCRLDLDGNGKREKAVDVANYLAPVVKMFSIHGLCLDLAALEPYMKPGGVEVIFYNGYHPRVGPNTIHGELLGLRTWAVAAWRSGLRGWADWQFRIDNGKNVFYQTNDDPERGRYFVGKNLYFYRGEQIGLPGKLFASLRLKSMRRGAQDYEMLRLLAIKDGNDKRAQAFASIACGAGFKEVKVDIKDFQDDIAGVQAPYAGVDKSAHWSHNPATWEKFRRSVGNALSAK